MTAPREGLHLLLLGGTGLVGSQVLRLALQDERVAQVVAPTRRALPPAPKLFNPVLDFNALPQDAAWWRVDAVVCALGTTLAKAGSKTAFRNTDLLLPLAIARLCRLQGASAFALNSALGADPTSSVFYSKTKGELEESLKTLGYPSLTLVRPGLLGGHRQEHRPAEQWAIRASQLLRPLLPRRYRVVAAECVAHHLLEAALRSAPGVHVLESESLVEHAGAPHRVHPGA